MRLLQRYILFELIRIFLMLLSGITILLVFVGVFREVTANGLGPSQALQILPFIVPSLLPFTIPATLLLTVCVVYGRMAGDNEITAAKAAGVNVMSLLWPAMALGGALSFFSLVMADKAIPWAQSNIKKAISMAMEDIFLDVLQTQGHVEDKDKGFDITVLRIEGKRLIKPTFHYQPKGSKRIIVQAEEATLKFDLDNQQVLLHMYNGHIDIPGQRQVTFAEEDQAFPLPFDTKKTKPRNQSIGQIRKRLQSLHNSLEGVRQVRDLETALALARGDFDRLLQPELNQYERISNVHRSEFAKMKTEIHSRFALSTSCFFFVLVGAPFSIIQAKRQFLTSFFLCFLPILLIYYPITLLTLNLSKSGSIDPFYLWLGNVVLLSVGFYLLRKVMRH